MNLCDYGCGKEAEFQLKSGKKCCCKSHNQCIENKRKNREKHIGKERLDMKINNPMYNTEVKDRWRNIIASVNFKEKIRISSVGRYHTGKSKEKISVANKGKRLGFKDSNETKIKKSLATTLEKNGNWKGGISFEPYCQIFSDKEFREMIFERDNYSCQNPTCTKKSIKICLHHINYIKKDCLPRNLITVCNSCNSKANSNREYWNKFYKQLVQKICNERKYA